MNVRRSSSTSLIWGRRQRRSGRGVKHDRPAAQAAGDPTVTFTPRTRRQGGPSQDRALYACGCGHLFDALVSTSVDCPECGNTQAW